MPIGTPFHSRTSALVRKPELAHLVRLLRRQFVRRDARLRVSRDSQHRRADRYFAALQVRRARQRRAEAGQPRDHPRRGQMRCRPGALRLPLRRRRCGDSRRHGVSACGRSFSFSSRRSEPPLAHAQRRRAWMCRSRKFPSRSPRWRCKVRNALKILEQVVDGDLAKLRFFRLTSAKLLDLPVIVSRTGYTGDLGYELWFGAEHAERIWDRFDGEG